MSNEDNTNEFLGGCFGYFVGLIIVEVILAYISYPDWKDIVLTAELYTLFLFELIFFINKVEGTRKRVFYFFLYWLPALFFGYLIGISFTMASILYVFGFIVNYLVKFSTASDEAEQLKGERDLSQEEKAYEALKRAEASGGPYIPIDLEQNEEMPTPQPPGREVQRFKPFGDEEIGSEPSPAEASQSAPTNTPHIETRQPEQSNDEEPDSAYPNNIPSLTESSRIEKLRTERSDDVPSDENEQQTQAESNAVENQRSSQNADISVRLFHAAMVHKGRITAAEAALDLRLPYEEVQGELENLASQGACQVTVGERGIIVYYFPEFEDDDHKKGVF